jgi:actin-related protein
LLSEKGSYQCRFGCQLESTLTRAAEAEAKHTLQSPSPVAIVTSIVGIRDRVMYKGLDTDNTQYLCGEKVFTSGKQFYHLVYPVHKGELCVSDEAREAIEQMIAQHCKDDGMFIVSESISATNRSRVQLCQLLFEKTGAAGVHFINQAVAAIASTGQSTGVVVESGHHSTHVVTVREGRGTLRDLFLHLLQSIFS